MLSLALLSLINLFPIIHGSNILYVGGLFSIFNDQGSVDVSQLEHASVFLQAIDEINSNPNILPNHEIRVVMGSGATILDVGVSSSEMFAMNSFVGAVSALDNVKGGYATKLFEESNYMIVNSMTIDTSFGDPDRYPLKAQTVPIFSYQGMVYQELLCRLNLTRIAIFTTDDLNGIRFGIELIDQTYCDINVLGRYTFPHYTTDFTKIFLDAIAVESRVFVVSITNPQTAREFLREGYRLGVFRADTRVLLAEIHGFGASLHTLDIDEVEAITRGLVSLEYAPDFTVYTTPRGLQFYNSWLNQTTLGDCSTKVDAVGHKYLLHGSTCASLNFTSYEIGETVMNAYTVLTYDATYTLAWGLHYAIESNQPLTARNLSQIIIDNVEFIGASGQIDIFEGMSDFNFIAKGNREVGLFYELQYFHFSLWKETGKGFRPFMLTNPEVGFTPCPLTMYCPPAEIVLDAGWVSAYPPYAFASPPSIVKLGGLFSAFLDGGSSLDKENAEFLAMFLMAIDEINNKTDGIHDDLLPDTQLKITVANSVNSALSGASSYEALAHSFYYRGVSGIVNTLSSDLVKTINSFAVEDELFQVLSLARDSDLSDGLQYSYKASTIPLDTFIGTVFQGYLCSSGLERISILAEDTSFGIRSTTDLLNTKEGCSLRVLTSHTFPTTTTDFTSILDEVENSGSRIIVIFAGASTTASLLLQGRSMKVFTVGMLYLTSESWSLSSELETVHKLDPEKVARVLRGVVSANLFPDYAVKYSPYGKSFVDRFLKFGTRRVESYTSNCKMFDDSGSRFLLRNTDTGNGCAELNYTNYITGAEELGVYASYAYDATYALAWAIQAVLSRSLPLTGENIRAAMFDSVEFEGASGEIDFIREANNRASYNQGNRKGGVYYRMLNFNEKVYLDLSSSSSISPSSLSLDSGEKNNGFVMIGLWSVENGLEKCQESIDCYEVVYDSRNSMIKDTGDSTWYVFSPSFRSFLFALGGVLIFLVLLFTILTIRFREFAEVQNSQEGLLYCILLGGLLAGGRVINSAIPLSDKSCLAGFWLSNFSFWFVMMAFFLKSWRVNRLLGTKSIKRVRITTSQIMRYMLFSVLFLVGILIILTLIGRPHRQVLQSESKNQMFYVPYCAQDHPEVQTALYVIHAFVMGIGLKTCWSLREVPKKFSDFHTIGSATIVIATFSIFVMPLVYLLKLRHDVSSSIATVAFGVGGIIVMLIVFGGKYLSFFKLTISTSKVIDDSSINSKTMPLQILSQDIVRSMNQDEQYEYYTKIIQKYTALRLQIDCPSEKSSHSSNRVGNPSNPDPEKVITSNREKYATPSEEC